MENITSSASLKSAILFLEVEKEIKAQELRAQFLLAYDSLKPANLIKSAFHEVTTSPGLINNILGVAVGLTSGYLSKTMAVGHSANIIRKFFGSILQFGVTNVVAQHSDSIKSFGQFIIHHIFQKKTPNQD